MSAELVRYDAMCRAIAEAYEIDEVKDIRDRAIAIAAYARQIKNFEAESQCARIRVRAEDRAGALLRDMEKAKGARGNPGGQGAPIVRSGDKTTQTLAELGISKDQSAKWQKLAALPRPKFEAELASQWRPTADSIINTIIPPPKPPPVGPDAVWFWGRLEEFKRIALDRDPAEFYDTMVDTMLTDVAELLPRVIAWLEQAREQCPNQKLDRFSTSSIESSTPVGRSNESARLG